LRFGDQGGDVTELVELLTAHGCPPRPPVTSAAPVFGRAVENSVLYFQMTHLGEDGDWLEVDGVVGPASWWALEHAAGQPQRSFLEVGIPEGIEGTRRSLLETAVKEHGVREDSGRPNRGPEVDKFLPPEITRRPDQPGQPWCCYFVSWTAREVYGKHILGRPVASCWVAWKRAQENERWLPNDGQEVPTPGDAFLILHGEPERGWCTGHIGFVLQVADDGRSFNTVEGNCGNRVKIGRRSLGDPLLRGFINIVGDRPDFLRGSLRGAKDLGTSGTR
jgi:hypothetical protein